MPNRNARAALAVAVAAVALLAVAPVGPAAAQDDCRAVEDRQVCVQGVSLSDQVLADGQQGQITVTVENVGNATASPSVMLSVAESANETGVYLIGQPTLAPGESTQLSQPLNATTVGTHAFQIQLLDPGTRVRFDTSEPVTLEVRDEPAPGLGGPIDRVELAVAGLAVALVGLAAVGYRAVGEYRE
jgi:hypothetical protein